MSDDKISVHPHIDLHSGRALSADEWSEKYGRPHALLRRLDRRFLLGFKEYEAAESASERRGIIRERYLHGILDLMLLPKLTDRQREKLVDEMHEEVRPGEVEKAVSRFIEFLFQYSGEDTEWLSERIKTGIGHGYTRLHSDESRHGAPDVSVPIDVDPPPDMDEIEERFRSSGAYVLSDKEKWLLVSKRDIDPDELEGNDPTMGSGEKPDPSDLEEMDSPFDGE